ncbi:MAG: HNH endonuclease, partial [Rhodococcus sp. (in: high G+C Gram-positive bacteria)]
MTDSVVLEPPSVAEIRTFTARLGLIDDYGDASGGVDALTAIEDLKCVGAAAQASVTDHVASRTRADRRERGVAS